MRLKCPRSGRAASISITSAGGQQKSVSGKTLKNRAAFCFPTTATTSTSSVLRRSPYALDAIEPTAIHGTPSAFRPVAKIASGLSSGIANFVAQRLLHLIRGPIKVLESDHRLPQNTGTRDSLQGKIQPPL